MPRAQRPHTIAGNGRRCPITKVKSKIPQKSKMPQKFADRAHSNTKDFALREHFAKINCEITAKFRKINLRERWCFYKINFGERGFEDDKKRD